MLSACATTTVAAPQPVASSATPTTATPTTATPTAVPAASAPPPLVAGLDLPGFDTQIRPQDDLYRYVDGTWLLTTKIPPDKSNYGTFTKLADDAEAAVHAVVEAAAAAGGAPGSDTRKIGDFYASFMDTTSVALAGLRPLQPELERIERLHSVRDIYQYIGYNQRIGVNQPIAYYVGQDGHDSSQYLAAIFQTGLTMPDRDYYLKPDDKNAQFRVKFEKYVATLLAIGGDRDAASSAKRVTALETRLANAHWTKVQNRDPVRTYNKVDFAGALRLAPTFDWLAFLQGAGVPANALNIRQPSFVQELARLVRSVPLDDWRVYFRFKLLDTYAPYLAPAFENAAFEFHSHVLRGIEQPPLRWKLAVQAMDGAMGELIGKLYVEKNFSPQAKQRMLALVGNLQQAFDRSIDQLDWMSPATKLEAKRKLGKINVKIGYPDHWRDYTALGVVRNDLSGNIQRANEFEFARQVAKLGKPLDRGEWLMTPQTVNAYYYPPLNEIVFPAAILRPPFFDLAADDAVNYGAIGAVIGHEMSHGFDDQGRQYDGDGNLRDWWTPEDNAKFRARADRLVAQYAAYPIIDNLKVNGELTLGENIGDLSGLAMAYKAWKIALNDRESPTIDAYSGAQRFFFGWATIWRRKYRDDELRMRAVSDPHSPSEYRCNVVVSNLDAFYDAFGVKAGDRLYRAPQDRVKIW